MSQPPKRQRSWPYLPPLWSRADCLTPEFPDYTCIVRSRKPWRYMAAVVRYNYSRQRYEPIQYWGPLAKPEAEAMAIRWAVEAKLLYMGVWS